MNLDNPDKTNISCVLQKLVLGKILDTLNKLNLFNFLQIGKTNWSNYWYFIVLTLWSIHVLLSLNWKYVLRPKSWFRYGCILGHYNPPFIHFFVFLSWDTSQAQQLWTTNVYIGTIQTSTFFKIKPFSTYPLFWIVTV